MANRVSSLRTAAAMLERAARAGDLPWILEIAGELRQHGLEAGEAKA